ncbi:MAG: TldD/PmbA family protein [Candidatus Bathyarchaeota archaeon]|nr:TldD/PmbA family protein [Candidatus Bathyarchaeota archaeon]
MAVLEKEFVLDLAEKAVKTALRCGALEAEVFVYDSTATTVGIERGQISKSQRIADRGIGVRVQLNRAIGFAYTNVVDSHDVIEEIICKALNAARSSKPDKNWCGLPKIKPFYATLEKTFDSKILDLGAEDLVTVASRMLNSASEDNNHVFPVEGGAGASYVSNAIANSNGISFFDKATIVECSLATIAKEGSVVTPVCFEFNAERTYNINPEWVGKEAARLAVSALNTKRIETKNYKLIFTQFALQELLYYTLINAVKADNVQRNQSPFKGALGEPVGSEVLTIYDDGLLAGGLRTGIFDGEGVPRQKTPVLEHGMLRSFLYDTYTAKKEGKESTGNASRPGYLSTPSIEATNFHILPGNKTSDELLNEVDDGLLVYYLQGAHSSNPISGEFSVVATPVWRIKKGHLEHSSRGVMLVGNIFNLLKNVAVVANNERKMGQLVAPWLLVEGVKVIGK